MSYLCDSRRLRRGKSPVFSVSGTFSPFFSGGGHAPPGTVSAPHLFKAAVGRRRAVQPSTQPRKQRGGRERHQSEHQMAHHFARAAHPHPAPPVAFLQQTVHPLAGTAFLEASCLRRCQWNLFPAARVGINDRHMPQLAAEGVDLRRVVGAVHQIVKRGHALRGHLRQRDGDLTVMHAGAGQDGAHRNVAVHSVQMQLVANPAFLMPFAVALAAHITADGQIGQVVGQRTRRLQLQPLGRGGRTHFAFLRTAAFNGRRRRGRGGFGRRTFGRLDGGGVATDVADEFVPGVSLHHVFVDALGQLVLGEGGEGAAEGRFAGNVPGTVPAAETAERRAVAQRFDQRGGGGELIDVLGDEGVGEPDTGTGWPALAAPRIAAGEAAQLGKRDDLAELLVQGGEFAEFLREGRKELALQAVEDRRQVEHDLQTRSRGGAFKRTHKKSQ